MTDFKVGDKVKRIKGDWSSCKEGDIVTVSRVSPDGSTIQAQEHGCIWFEAHKFELAQKTMDNLKPGDVFVDVSEEYRYVVLAVAEGFVVNTLLDSHSGGNEFYVEELESLKGDGYHIPGEKKEMVELTLEEVAKLKGVPVDQIRIKD